MPADRPVDTETLAAIRDRHTRVLDGFPEYNSERPEENQLVTYDVPLLLNHTDRLTAALAAEQEHNRRLVTRWRGRVERAEQQYQALEAAFASERERAKGLGKAHAEAWQAFSVALAERDSLRAEAARLAGVVEAATRLMTAKGPGAYKTAFDDLYDAVRALSAAEEGSDG